MSWATLESAVLHGARAVLKNPKLRKKDILEWSTGEVKAAAGEVVFRVEDPGVNVCVPVGCDKRK